MHEFLIIKIDSGMHFSAAAAAFFFGNILGLLGQHVLFWFLPSLA
jgi:hypothetical protein